MTYYNSYERLLRQYDQCNRTLGFKACNLEEYREWKLVSQGKLSELLGLPQMELVPMRVECIEKVDYEEYAREKYILEVESEVYMPFYKLIPKVNKKEHNIIAVHGHGAFGKDGVAGVLTDYKVNEVERYNTDYGLQMVKEGFTVYCPEARGFGERREFLEQGDELTQQNKSSCNSLNFTAIAMGMTLVGMWVWDLMRLIDYIKGEDSKKLNSALENEMAISFHNPINLDVIGFSGGGLQALFLSALDERVNKTVISGYYHSYRDSILRTNQCGCNFVPGLYKYLEIGDIGALIAPRPLFVESGYEDKLNGPRGILDVKEQVQITQRAYDLFHRKENLTHKIHPAGHRWNGEGIVDFLA